MKLLFSKYLLHLVLLIGLSQFFISCEAKTKTYADNIILVASTPCNDQMKSLLGISADKKIDFIRWEISLANEGATNDVFTLHINYGESQPNTLGFIHGGEKKSIEGDYTLTSQQDDSNRSICHLKSTGLNGEMLIAKINSNLWHFLTPQEELMVGNGGWSYTLNRKELLTDTNPEAVVSQDFAEQDTATEIIFEGRTPCSEISKDKHLDTSPDCFKIKWKIVLNRDGKAGQNGTYTTNRTGHRQSAITGKWNIKKGIPSSPEAVVYELHPNTPDNSLSLWLADKNVAFILDSDNRPFVGNENFSYTLNRRQ